MTDLTIDLLPSAPGTLDPADLFMCSAAGGDPTFTFTRDIAALQVYLFLGGVQNANLATMAARTVKANATNASAVPQDVQGTVALTYLRVNAAITGLEFGALPADAVPSVFGRTGAVIAVAGDYTAAQVTNTPAGNIAATTAQAAINELDTEKAGLALANAFTAAQTINTATAKALTLGGSATPYLSILSTGGVEVFVQTNGSNGLFGTITNNGFELYSNAIARMVIPAAGGMYMVGATGSGQGVGTINAVNYFDDGVNINAIYAGLAAANNFSQVQTITRTSGNTTAIFTGQDPSISIRNTGAGTQRWDVTCGRFVSNDGVFAFQDVTAGVDAFVCYPNGATRFGNSSGGNTGVNTINAPSLYVQGTIAIDSAGLLRPRVFTVGTLPTASGVTGSTARVSDSLAAPVYNAAAVGGGTINAQVMSDGTIWRYC